MKLSQLLSKMPSKETLQKSAHLRLLIPLMQRRQYLWAWRRQNVSNAAFWSMICAFTPWPLQMIQAALFSVLFRTHMPVTVALVWITNPITMPILFYSAYMVGTSVLGVEPEIQHFQADWRWLKTLVIEVWKPLLVGCLICGISTGIIFKYSISFVWIRLVREKRKRNQSD